ncbi:MAG: aminotransferase class I/II-fold pyridoxal phosphate-dependent enzyme [Pseudonocardiales bacterium]|nr:aminotransferase class I/II-fold pyridoxal phosphate-dependent enzyme [Pseudonocardiales bacterium]
MTLLDDRHRTTLKWRGVGPDVLPAWVAEMDVEPAPAVRAALHEAVDAGLTGYPVPEHLTGLPEATAGWCREAYGWHVDPSRVRLTLDVLHGIAAGLTALDPGGGPVVLPTPAYPPFFDVLRATGRPVVEVPLARDGGRFALDLGAIDAALGAGARTVLLCSPHNPTGTVFPREDLAALAALVERHGARVVADEVHAPLTHTGYRHVPYGSVAPGHSVTVTSASKGWNLPGLKCAQVLLTADADVGRWETLPAHERCSAAPMGVAANRAAYTAGTAWLDALRAELDANRRLLDGLLAERLPEVVPAEGGATYLAWLDCTATGVDDPAAFFLDAGVALGDGERFGRVGRGHVRLNYATSPAVLERIVERMAGALSRRRAGPRAG